VIDHAGAGAAAAMSHMCGRCGCELPPL
jgi:hypothetical protein